MSTSTPVYTISATEKQALGKRKADEIEANREEARARFEADYGRLLDFNIAADEAEVSVRCVSTALPQLTTLQHALEGILLDLTDEERSDLAEIDGTRDDSTNDEAVDEQQGNLPSGDGSPVRLADQVRSDLHELQLKHGDTPGVVVLIERGLERVRAAWFGLLEANFALPEVHRKVIQKSELVNIAASTIQRATEDSTKIVRMDGDKLKQVSGDLKLFLATSLANQERTKRSLAGSPEAESEVLQSMAGENSFGEVLKGIGIALQDLRQCLTEWDLTSTKPEAHASKTPTASNKSAHHALLGSGYLSVANPGPLQIGEAVFALTQSANTLSPITKPNATRSKLDLSVPMSSSPHVKKGGDYLGRVDGFKGHKKPGTQRDRFATPAPILARSPVVPHAAGDTADEHVTSTPSADTSELGVAQPASVSQQNVKAANSRKNRAPTKKTKAEGRKGGSLAKWGAAEELYVAEQWFGDDLMIDKAKTHPSNGNFVGTKARADAHNQWIVGQGGDLSTWWRTWPAMEQRMEHCRKNRETLSSLRAKAGREARTNTVEDSMDVDDEIAYGDEDGGTSTSVYAKDASAGEARSTVLFDAEIYNLAMSGTAPSNMGESKDRQENTTEGNSSVESAKAKVADPKDDSEKL
ncbi:hypothetical protein BAUCODRAFT_183232 [Baudoinia panamericana UAMH 10762]|uniref:Uncharacterized protein n=1 Tax=Baudoinia panamericana (strain UAMH 10762) TaxID=717646 RepID=M2N9D7_BAUPA|nr:uncharacterized protein BAUCODRAFT_183232 [Baudoinia panamericana UAMH 10762]EMD00794.1 hypothetical protein BAUCODRAFT_183232 [Baudoinia panamericana UAMH 10762]